MAKKPEIMNPAGYWSQLRSAGLLQTLKAAPHPPLIGDFSLNAAKALLEMGFERLAPPRDLNAAQVAELALSGVLSAAELGRRFKGCAPQGSTEGSLYVPDAAWSL